MEPHRRRTRRLRTRRPSAAPSGAGPDEPDRRAGSSIVSEPRSDDATEERAPPLDVSVERRRARRGESAVSEPAPECCEGIEGGASASAAGLSG